MEFAIVYHVIPEVCVDSCNKPLLLGRIVPGGAGLELAGLKHIYRKACTVYKISEPLQISLNNLLKYRSN